MLNPIKARLARRAAPSSLDPGPNAQPAPAVTARPKQGPHTPLCPNPSPPYLTLCPTAPAAGARSSPRSWAAQPASRAVGGAQRAQAMMALWARRRGRHAPAPTLVTSANAPGACVRAARALAAPAGESAGACAAARRAASARQGGGLAGACAAPRQTSSAAWPGHGSGLQQCSPPGMLTFATRSALLNLLNFAQLCSTLLNFAQLFQSPSHSSASSQRCRLLILAQREPAAAHLHGRRQNGSRRLHRRGNCLGRHRRRLLHGHRRLLRGN